MRWSPRCLIRARRAAHFSFDLTTESSLEGHVRIFDCGLAVSVRGMRLTTTCARPSRRDGEQISWNQRFPRVARALRVPRDGVHAGDAAREGFGRGRCQAPQERVLAGAPVRVPGRARRAIRALARRGLQSAHPRYRPVRGRRAPRARERGPAAAAADPVRFLRRAAGPSPAGTATSSSAATSTGHRSRWSISASSCALTATTSGSAMPAQTSPTIRAAGTAATGSRHHNCGPSCRRRRRSHS